MSGKESGLPLGAGGQFDRRIPSIPTSRWVREDSVGQAHQLRESNTVCESDQAPHLPIDGQIKPGPPQMVSPNAQMDNYLPAGLQSGLPTMDSDSGVFSVDGTFFPDFIPDSLIPSLTRMSDLDPLPVLPQDSIHNVFDHNVDFDFDLTDLDYGLIDLFNSRGAVHHHHHHHAYNSDGATEHGDADSGIAIGAEAYHRSSLSAWKPAREDHAFADQENLSVPEAIDSPEANFRPDRQMVSERLSPSGRDRIFGLVLQTSQRTNLTRIMKSFPSTQLLDSLIQYYFESQCHDIDSWIHGPTFRMNDEAPDMLAALAAAGATRSTIPTIRKLGYALMEIVRLQLSDKVRWYLYLPAAKEYQLTLLTCSTRATIPPYAICAPRRRLR